jgi:undecaprenyl-diphosphatase
MPRRTGGDRKNLMNYLQILVLAVIQGAAELLPVSSSAHVIFAAKLMGLKPSSPEFVFLLVMLHTGTMFAVLIYFWPRWRWLFVPSIASPPGVRRHYFLMLILATAITGVFGLALKYGIEKIVLERWLGHAKGEVEHLFESLPLIAGSLFSVGVIIIIAGSRKTPNDGGTITTGSAIWIGMVQGVCLPFRGFSRSGATISTALFRGIARPLAEDFSFALAVILTPPIIVWQVLKLLDADKQVGAATLWDMLLPGLAGMVLSFVAGLVALKFLSAALEKGRWKYFGYYCIAAAAVIATAGLLEYLK